MPKFIVNMAVEIEAKDLQNATEYLFEIEHSTLQIRDFQMSPKWESLPMNLGPAQAREGEEVRRQEWHYMSLIQR